MNRHDIRRSKRASSSARLLIFLLLSLSLLAAPAQAGVSSAVEKRIISFIMKFYGDRDDMQIKIDHLPDALRDRPAVKNINFGKIPDSNGYGTCIVEIAGRGRRARNVYVPFNVTVKRQLFVLLSDMKRGDVIREGDIDTRETFINDRHASYPQDIDDVIGRVVKRSMIAGTVLTKASLEDSYLVRRGEIVNIVVDNNKLLVQTKGRALDRGRAGDTIRVKNITSNREITGTVTGSGTVLVEL